MNETPQHHLDHSSDPGGLVRHRQTVKRPRHFLFWFWMAWLGVFAGVEAWAIVTCPDECTLSASVWFLQRQWWPLTVILAVLLLFLIWHFVVDRRSRK